VKVKVKVKYVNLWPPCTNGNFQDCDVYAEIYFDQQGYDLLLEELLQYINDAAASYAVADLEGSGFIERHGAITMLWWLERYLKIMRTTPEFAPKYDALLADECWRDLTLTIWGRGWQFLDATAESATDNDNILQAFVEDPALLSEIERVRAASSCN